MYVINYARCKEYRQGKWDHKTIREMECQQYLHCIDLHSHLLGTDRQTDRQTDRLLNHRESKDNQSERGPRGLSTVHKEGTGNQPGGGWLGTDNQTDGAHTLGHCQLYIERAQTVRRAHCLLYIHRTLIFQGLTSHTSYCNVQSTNE